MTALHERPADFGMLRWTGSTNMFGMSKAGRVSPSRRLIMIAGSSPGAGESTLMRGLVAHCRSAGVDVRPIEEDDVWGRRPVGDEPADRLTALPGFVALLRKEASSLADGSDVLAAFDRVVGDPPHEDVFVQDWTWLDLAAHMSWALTDPSAFNAFAAELRRRAEHLDPVLLYLSVDTDRGVRRAADERGQRWLTRHADTFASIREPGVTVESVATFYREHEHKRIERLTTGGWNPS